ncbi:MAG: response regulator transcription factor [Candidatus Acidiferrales bacterium]
MSVLKILVADDHDLMRRGLRDILTAHPGWTVCGEAHTGVEAVAKAKALKPDIAILDINMPELSGLEAAKQIRATLPKTELLVLSVHYSDQLVRDIVDSGIRGYMIKSDADKDLLTAVEALANHQPYFTAAAIDVIGHGLFNRRSSEPNEMKDRLTSREREVVRLIAEGKSSKDVGAVLDMSVKTVETHRANVMRKLQVHSVSELVRYAIRNQIVEA